MIIRSEPGFANKLFLWIGQYTVVFFFKCGMIQRTVYGKCAGKTKKFNKDIYITQGTIKVTQMNEWSSSLFLLSKHSKYIAKWMEIGAFGFQKGIGRGFDFIHLESDS